MIRILIVLLLIATISTPLFSITTPSPLLEYAYMKYRLNIPSDEWPLYKYISKAPISFTFLFKYKIGNNIAIYYSTEPIDTVNAYIVDLDDVSHYKKYTIKDLNKSYILQPLDEYAAYITLPCKYMLLLGLDNSINTSIQAPHDVKSLKASTYYNDKLYIIAEKNSPTPEYYLGYIDVENKDWTYHVITILKTGKRISGYPFYKRVGPLWFFGQYIINLEDYSIQKISLDYPDLYTVSPDGRYLVAQYSNGSLIVFDVSTNQSLGIIDPGSLGLSEILLYNYKSITIEPSHAWIDESTVLVNGKKGSYMGIYMVKISGTTVSIEKVYSPVHGIIQYLAPGLLTIKPLNGEVLYIGRLKGSVIDVGGVIKLPNYKEISIVFPLRNGDLLLFGSSNNPFMPASSGLYLFKPKSTVHRATPKSLTLEFKFSTEYLGIRIYIGLDNPNNADVYGFINVEVLNEKGNNIYPRGSPLKMYPDNDTSIRSEEITLSRDDINFNATYTIVIDDCYLHTKYSDNYQLVYILKTWNTTFTPGNLLKKTSNTTTATSTPTTTTTPSQPTTTTPQTTTSTGAGAASSAGGSTGESTGTTTSNTGGGGIPSTGLIAAGIIVTLVVIVAVLVFMKH